MHKIREAAIARLKAEQNPSSLLVLERDERLQATLALWRFFEFKEDRAPKAKSIDGKSMVELAAIAWDGISYDEEQVAIVLAVRTHAVEKVVQASRIGIGYPDGTIHPLAEAWLATKVRAMLQTPKRKT